MVPSESNSTDRIYAIAPLLIFLPVILENGGRGRGKHKHALKSHFQSFSVEK